MSIEYFKFVWLGEDSLLGSLKEFFGNYFGNFFLVFIIVSGGILCFYVYIVNVLNIVYLIFSSILMVVIVVNFIVLFIFMFG